MSCLFSIQSDNLHLLTKVFIWGHLHVMWFRRSWFKSPILLFVFYSVLHSPFPLILPSFRLCIFLWFHHFSFTDLLAVTLYNAGGWGTDGHQVRNPHIAFDSIRTQSSLGTHGALSPDPEDGYQNPRMFKPPHRMARTKAYRRLSTAADSQPQIQNRTGAYRKKKSSQWTRAVQTHVV